MWPFRRKTLSPDWQMPNQVDMEYNWKLFLYFGANDHSKVLLPITSQYNDKQRVLEEVNDWLNDKAIPDVVMFENMSIRRSAVLWADADRG